MAILVTGGAGYIGSHTLIELAKSGYDFVVLDNLVNSDIEAVRRVSKLTGREIPFYNYDMADPKAYEEIFKENKIEACIHFAGLKAVGESVEKPLLYYDNNVGGSIVLFEELLKRNVKKIIFSSSATVYGDPAEIPITEECPKGSITNPYGKTKAMIEEILCDLAGANDGMKVVLLRYFNPIGAHESGMIGEDPKGIPNNLMPYITQVAVGELSCLNIFGDDYNTPDGTCIRDYVHVVDLAKGHVKSLERINVLPEKEENQDFAEPDNKSEVLIYNLGTGKGYSVLEIVNTFCRANGIDIDRKIADRRPGDVPVMYCNAEKAFNELGWKAEFDLEKMCIDAWNWQSNNPKGYGC